LLLVFALLGVFSVPGWAQEFEPRTYAVAPPGLNFVGVAYGFANGAVFMDPSLPAKDVDADVHLVVMRYVRTLELFGLPSKLKVALPLSDGHWEGFVEDEYRVRDATGLGDARLILETQFAGTKDPSRTVWGAKVQFILPTGQYDNTRAINLSANRWGAIPEVGFSYPAGKWDFEGALAAWIFGDNDEFLGIRSVRASGGRWPPATATAAEPRSTASRGTPPRATGGWRS
jgi:hypothetical protein